EHGFRPARRSPRRRYKFEDDASRSSVPVGLPPTAVAGMAASVERKTVNSLQIDIQLTPIENWCEVNCDSADRLVRRSRQSINPVGIYKNVTGEFASIWSLLRGKQIGIPRQPPAPVRSLGQNRQSVA